MGQNLATQLITMAVRLQQMHPALAHVPGKDWFRIQKPVPTDSLWTAKKGSISLPGQVGLPGIRHSIGLARWWHLGIDALWLLNGLVFYVLLFSTGQWRRVVPTSWEAVPNAGSELIQYLSLSWPTESGWTAYNSLQLFAYLVTVFVAAPVALVTGLGMSPALSTRFKRVSRVLSIQTARSLQFLVLISLVVTTGIYYDAHPIERMSYHLSMLAYDMNGEPLLFGHGAPLRLRLRKETQLGFKQVKWVKPVEFVAHYWQIRGGYGGYNRGARFLRLPTVDLAVNYRPTTREPMEGEDRMGNSSLRVLCPQQNAAQVAAPRKLSWAGKLPDTLNRGPVRPAGSRLVPSPAGGR